MNYIAFKRWALLSVALGLLSLANALADQNDTQLNQLFSELKTAQSEQQALELEQAIWKIWFSIDDAKEQALMDRANQLMEVSDFSGARTLYNELIASRPEYAEAWNRRATLNYLMGDYSASLNDVERTLELEPRHFGAWSGLGLLMLALDKPKEALRAYQRVLTINPQSTVAKQQIEQLQRLLNIQSI